MKIGQLVRWQKKDDCGDEFGFIETFGDKKRYFVHKSRINFVTSQIKVGCFVLFEASNCTPKKSGAAPFVSIAEIYDSLAHAELINNAVDATVPLPNKRGV